MVVSVHTRSPTSAAWTRARDDFFAQLDVFLASQPKDLPIVVSGDMNATPDNSGFRALLSKAKWSQEPDAWRPTWHSSLAERGLGFRIDRTIGKQGAAVAKWSPLKRGPSDHLFSSSQIRIER
jgi:endonuclease/exonuclease/phosphatase family metal-dependent hydrolase